MNSWDLARAAAVVLPPLVSLFCVVLTRLSVGSSWQAFCQRGFFSWMLLLAAVMLAALAFSYAITISYGASLAVMAVAAVWDSGASSRFVG